MKNITTIFFFVLTFFFFSSVQIFAAGTARWTGRTSTAWETASNWSTVTGTPSFPPSSNDAVIIGDTIFTAQPVVNSNTTISSLAFDSTTSATLTVSNGVTLTVTNAVTMKSATLISTSAIITGSGTISSASVTCGTAGASNLPLADRTTILTTTINTFNVTNGVTVTSYKNGGSTNLATFQLSTGTMTVGTTITMSASGGANGAIGTFTLASGAASGTLTLTGSAPFSGGGTFNANGNDATVIYAGTNQTVRTTTYGNLSIQGTGTTTIGGAITVNKALSVVSGGVLADNGNTITGSGTGTFTMGSGGTFIIGTATVATSFPSAYINANIFLSNSTVIYNSNLAQTISGVPTYANLQLSATASVTKTLGAATTITGNLTIDANNTLSVSGSNFAITLGGNFINNGTFSSGTGTVNCNGTSAQAIAGVTYSTLKINNTAGVSLSAAATVSTLTIGDVTTNSLFYDNGSEVTSTGTLNLSSGTFKLGAGTATTFPAFTTRNISTGTTVEFAATVAQTVSSTPSYRNLTFSGAGTKTPASGTLSIAENWSVGSATALNTNNTAVSVTGNVSGAGQITVGTSNIIVSGNWTNTGGTTGGTGEVQINGASPTIGAATFNNLTLNNSTGATATGSITVNGTFTLTNGTFSIGTNTLTLNSTVSATSGFLTSTSTGTVNYNQSSNGQSVMSANYGNLTFSNFNKTLASSGTIGIEGAFTTGNASGHTISNSTIEFNAPSAQTIPAFNYYNLTSSDSGSRTLASTGTIGVAGTFTPGTNAYTITGSTVDYNGTGAQTLAAFNYNNLTTSGARSSNNITLSSSGTIGIAGTLSLSASSVSYVVSGSTVAFNGGSQSIPSFTFNNLTISGSNNKTGGANFTVNGILLLSNNISMGANILTMGGNATSDGTGDVTGIVRRTTFVADSSYSFGNPYTSITFASGGVYPTQIDVSTSTGSTPAGKSDAIQRYYEITQTGGSGFSATLRLHYLNSELNGIPDSNLSVWKFSGSWADQGRTGAVNTTNKYAERSNLTALGTSWTLANIGLTSLDHFDISFAVTETVGVAFVGVNTITAKDAGGVTLTGFDAAGNSVTITSSPSDGTITGLGSGNNHIFNQTGDFVNGVANVTGTMIFTGTSGNHTFTATSGTGKTGTSGTVTIYTGAATKLGFTSQPGNGTGGRVLSTQPIVSVQDAGGNLISSATNSITLAIGTNANSGTLSVDANPLNATGGSATFSGVKIDKAGNGYTLSATAAGLTSATSSLFNITVGPGVKLGFTTQPGNGTGGSNLSIQPVVAVQDSGGNTVTGATDAVTLSIGTNPSSGTLNADSNPLDAASGLAAFSGVKIDKAGTGYTLTASASGLDAATSNSFNITVGPAIKLAFTTQPGDGTGGSDLSAQPVVTVQDAGGNTVSSSSHAVSLAIGTNPVGGVLSALTNPLNASNGVASFSNVKINKAGDGYTLVATATLQGFATITSNSFNIIVGPPSKLSFTVQPGNGNGGNLLSIQPIVTVQDAGGNAVDTATNEITLTIGTNPCGGTLVAVENPLSASNGFAVFSGLKIDKACVGYRLTASSGTFTPAVSNLFNVNVGPAAKLSFTTQPGDGAGGSNLSTQPAVSVQDLGGNTVTSSSHSITLAIGNNPSGGTLSVESNPLNASSGVASYSGVQINKAGIGYTLTASTTGGVTGATSDSFDITFGTAAKLVFTTQPSNGIIGNNLATQPVVNIEDAVGNIVTNASNAITLALGANPSGAILTVGSNPINAVSGVATFSGVKLDKIGIGYTLRASAGGFPDSFSTTFNITDFDGVISGQKFNDYNYDGDKDGDEPGLQNWRIKLSGARTESTLTDINGNYSFIGLPPGNYQVNEVNQSGWQQTMPTSPSTYSLTITNAGGTLGGNDFGNYRFASISGLSFNDFNGNGFRELGEGGLSGWKIFLYKTDTLTLVDSITTTEEGYTFAGLVPGTYFVRKQSQDDWIPTSEVPPAIEIYSGFNISGVNFGNYQYGYISGTLFVDIDNNSTKDVGDVALEGWKVSLSGPKTDSAFSDASGNYMFDTLEAGSYTVLAEVQDGWRQNVPSASGSYFLSVVSGGALSGKNFGMFQLGTVSGLVFDDINGNAVKENGEPGVANWKLLIFGAKNDTLVTDSSGVYSVDHLQPGGYIISNVLPSNWVQTIPANNEVYVHNISTSGTNTGGNTFAIFQKGSISGYIYNDKNADAFFDVDSGEARQSGWTVNISGPISSTTVTNDSGYYSFTGLPNGLFTVTEVNQSGWSQTFPPTQGGAYSIAMSSGGSFTNKNFGNYGGRIKLRTFKSTTDLSAKPQKMKYSKKTGAIVGTPNLATAVQAVFQKLGKLGATFLGVPQTSKDSAKKYGWIYYKKAVELGKLFTGAHSGQSYPIDYVRIPGKPDKLLSKAIKANRKKFDNPLWEQAVLFKLNLLASNYGITPTGLGNLQVLSTPIVLAGRSLNDMTLGEISTYLDTVMTYWKSKEITTSAAYNNLESFRTQILKPLNEGFAQDFNSATYEIDTNGIRNLKNPYAIKMTGYKTASEVGIVREIPLTRISEPLPPQPQQFPDDYALLQNYPNPFNPITTIRFELPEESEVSLTIYDMLGREVASILINEELEEGSHDIEFDAANIASGVYFYRITATSLEKRNTFTQVKKMVLTK